MAGWTEENFRLLLPAVETYLDGLRDTFNNSVGLEIADFVTSASLPEGAIGILVNDALNRGLLIVNEFDDPRISTSKIDPGSV
jgi:hypothetical protein